jgi:hypothetical protein
MKTINKIKEITGADRIILINFKIAWCNAKVKRKGYGLIFNNSEKITIEPCQNRSFKWLVSFKLKDNLKLFHCKNINDVKKKIIIALNN